MTQTTKKCLPCESIIYIVSVSYLKFYRNRRKLIHQQKLKFTEKRKQSSHGLYESQSMAPKTTDKPTAMEWANTETDNFVNINKYIFSTDEPEPNDYMAPKTSAGMRVKSLPKTTPAINECPDTGNHFTGGSNGVARLMDLDSHNEKPDGRPARFSGFFSTMKFSHNEGLFPSTHMNAQESSHPKLKGKIQVINTIIQTLINLVEK